MIRGLNLSKFQMMEIHKSPSFSITKMDSAAGLCTRRPWLSNHKLDQVVGTTSCCWKYMSIYVSILYRAKLLALNTVIVSVLETVSNSCKKRGND